MEIIGNIILGLLSTYYIVSGLTMIIMSLKTIKDIKNAKNSKIKLKNNYYIILPVLKVLVSMLKLMIKNSILLK